MQIVLNKKLPKWVVFRDIFLMSIQLVQISLNKILLNWEIFRDIFFISVFEFLFAQHNNLYMPQLTGVKNFQTETLNIPTTVNCKIINFFKLNHRVVFRISYWIHFSLHLTFIYNFDILLPSLDNFHNVCTLI